MQVKLMCLFYFHSNSSSEGRPFRLGTGANMEKVVKMDRDMTKVRKEIENYSAGDQLEFFALTDIKFLIAYIVFYFSFILQNTLEGQLYIIMLAEGSC